MPTNDFLPWAIGGGANVEAQATYVADPVVTNGETTGTATSARSNKVWRQASVVAYAVAQLICDFTGLNAADDTNTAGFLANLKLALTNMMWSTGDVKLTYLTAAPSGWIMMTDGTIGSAASGATYANANAAQLYAVIWGNISNAFAPVTGGRGGSASADFTANKPMALPKVLGMAMAGAGAGAGLTARSLGQFMNPSTTPKGEEFHALTSGEAPPLNSSVIYGGGGLGATTAYTGANGTGHNTMQPTTFLNVMIKL